MFTVYTLTRDDTVTIYRLQAELEAQGIHTYLRMMDYPNGIAVPVSLCVLREEDMAPAGAIIQDIVKESEPNWRPNS